MSGNTSALLLVLMLIGTSTTLAQATDKTKVAAAKPPATLKRPTPTIADYKYGDESPRQVFDFWQAKSDKPTPLVLLIHSGGWQARDKKADFGDDDINPLLDAGISVAAINYRFIQQGMEQHVEPPVKACLYDAARALQTIRSKSKECEPARRAGRDFDRKSLRPWRERLRYQALRTPSDRAEMMRAQLRVPL